MKQIDFPFWHLWLAATVAGHVYIHLNQCCLHPSWKEMSTAVGLMQAGLILWFLRLWKEYDVSIDFIFYTRYWCSKSISTSAWVKERSVCSFQHLCQIHWVCKFSIVTHWSLAEHPSNSPPASISDTQSCAATIPSHRQLHFSYSHALW